MPSKTLDRERAPHTSDTEGGGRVLPFSRDRLGRGADTGEGSRMLAARACEEYPLGGSPVWMPGDPRLSRPTPTP